MINKIDLGFRITEKRKRLKISQSQLGEMLGVSHVAISDIERGKTNLNVEEISKIAGLLKTTFEELTFTNEIGSLGQTFNYPSLNMADFRLGKQANEDDIKQADKIFKDRLKQLREERK